MTVDEEATKGNSARSAGKNYAEPAGFEDKLVVTCDTCSKEISTLPELQSGSLSGRIIRDRVCRCRATLVGEVFPEKSPENSPDGSLSLGLSGGLSTGLSGSFSGSLTGESVRRRLTATGTYFEGFARSEILPVGTVIGGVYEILEVIGQGGMGVVYKVKHLTLAKILALKVLPANLYNEKNWKRFQAEAKSLAALKHPALVGVYDLGVHEGATPYYTMDYLEGKSLQQLLIEGGPLSVQEAVEVFLKVLEGLKYAHDQQIIHRDIKPANIFLCSTASGGLSVKLLDFGIAKLSYLDRGVNQSLTAAGDIFGSPYYMSPEQCVGEELDRRSDIYSMGCSLFEALTGEVPFEGPNIIATLLMHQKNEPPPMSSFGLKFPGRLEKIVARCLSKNPDDRPSSAAELATELKLVLTRPEEGKYSSQFLLNWVEPKGPDKPIDLEKGASEADELEESSLVAIAKERDGDPALSGSVFASLVQKQSDREGTRREAQAPNLLTYCLLSFIFLAGMVVVFSQSLFAPNARRPDSGPRAAHTSSEAAPVSSLRELSFRAPFVFGSYQSRGMTEYLSQVEGMPGQFDQFRVPATGASDLGVVLASNLQGLSASDASTDDNLLNYKLLLPGRALIIKPQLFSKLPEKKFEAVDFTTLCARVSADEPSILKPIDCANFTQITEQLRQLPYLTGLGLSGNSITDKELPEVDRLLKLRCLDLTDTRVTTEGILALKRLPELYSLEVSKLDRPSALMKVLGNSKNLKRLVIAGTELSDEGLRALSRSAQLETLCISDMKLSHNALKVILAMPRLKSLNIEYCDIQTKDITDLPASRSLNRMFIQVSAPGQLDFFINYLNSGQYKKDYLLNHVSLQEPQKVLLIPFMHHTIMPGGANK